MLTVTLLLLHGKLIPLRFFPWYGNLVTLGCRRILVFRCFSKVKNRRCCFKSAAPRNKLAEIRRACCQNVCRQDHVCEFWLFFSLKSYAFFSRAVLFFLFSNFTSCKKITNVSAKNLRHGFWVNVWRNLCHVYRFLRPKFSGRILWFMGLWSFVNIFTFSKMVDFLPFTYRVIICSYYASKKYMVYMGFC